MFHQALSRNRRACIVLSLLAIFLGAINPPAGAQSRDEAPLAFSFGFMHRPADAPLGDTWLKQVIEATNAANLAFVVNNGIKAAAEPCSDDLYRSRLTLLQSAQNGVIDSLAGTDWTRCRTKDGEDDDMVRLSRLRDLFFEDDNSLGATRLPLIRQSTTPKFHAYAENARWEIGHIVFATIHLPANNNHFLADGGRNSEFEDRTIANRSWLKRLFLYAHVNKATAIVLFSDGDPLAKPTHRLLDFGTRRDGFSEVRQQIESLTQKFSGRVLLVHSDTTGQTRSRSAPHIAWNKNLGAISVTGNWVSIQVDPGNPVEFTANVDIAATTAAPLQREPPSLP